MEKIAAAFVFIISFIMVTALIAFLNLWYYNIFDFDFRPNVQAVELKTAEQIEEIKIKLRPEIEKEVFDSLKTIGFDSASVINTNKRLALLEDSVKVLTARNKKLEKEIQNKTVAQKNDSEQKYKTWTQNTAKLYESMDSKKAAKIILKYSDNIARDILYSMKKKKAAAILSELNPEVAKRITRVP